MPEDTLNQRLLSLDDGAALLGISKFTLRAYAQRLLVPTVRFGRRRLISRKTIADLVQHGISPADAKRGRPSAAAKSA